uniref:probable E3 ubiquitin-protein ligase makorin-1 n=1 Tax=Euleptes europaea TaxID=460621 RepID=UPI002542106C|nr:probable E3 ubiquitin-protein ligase makorin-1 [Euleptes europaea]
MEPGVFVGESGRQAARGSGSSRVPCRNFARGACKWGQNCRFSHDRKMTQTQICRYFQNGFCGYGDRCSYQHISEVPALTRCGSESAFHGLQGGVISLNRRGSEPAILPEASVTSWGGARRGSEPAVSSVAQLQRNFGSLSMSLDEEEEDKEKVITAWHPPNWALSKEFVPRQTPSGSRPHEHKVDTASLETEDASTKEPPPASVAIQESKAAGGSGAAAAAIEKSEDVVCGICMDKVYEKTLPEERLFGILPNCSHAYCVGCIRKWRKSRDFQNAVIKGCPECRVTSSYFIPNKYWVSDTDEKEKLIETFKARTGKIRCRYFVRGNGHCPFKSECIYLHELPGGQVPVPRPRRRPDRRRRQPIIYNLSPSESSDEDENDIYLVQWALTIALLERDSDFSDFLFWDSSDSD